MKQSLLCIFVCLSLLSSAQTSTTFKIEKLSKPENLLELKLVDNIYKSMIIEDAGISGYDFSQGNGKIPYDIVARSKSPDSLVSFGYHAFFNGMYQAYADHRPFVLSPDMVWLLISQGFARHINANPEEMRKYLVDFSGKISLVLRNDLISLEDTDTPWETVFPGFTSQIAQHTGKELMDILTADFSTTTPTTRVASEITIMEAMEPFFEYVVIRIICGIPEITLLGTPQDWEKVLDKTRSLEKYDLKWWTSELEPLLDEFVNASRGNVDKAFWRNMFKYHSQKVYGAPRAIDGWIVKFFPYNKHGQRNNLLKLYDGDNLPEEMVKVDLKFLEVDGIVINETMLELWAGFTGLEQNPETFALTPHIGWMIRKKNANGLKENLEKENIPGSGSIDLRIIEVPEELKALSEIYSLSLRFTGEVKIPEWMKNLRIGRLSLEGKISNSEKDKILDWFPHTELNINNEKYHEGKNGWVIVNGRTNPREVLEMKEIWILEIRDFNVKALLVSGSLGKIKIDIIKLGGETSEEDIVRIMELLPSTRIYVDNKRIK
jgi:hypothetical protein